MTYENTKGKRGVRHQMTDPDPLTTNPEDTPALKNPPLPQL